MAPFACYCCANYKTLYFFYKSPKFVIIRNSICLAIYLSNHLTQLQHSYKHYIHRGTSLKPSQSCSTPLLIAHSRCACKSPERGAFVAGWQHLNIYVTCALSSAVPRNFITSRTSGNCRS